MPKVRIIGPIDSELREALMELLGEAGCEILDDLPEDEAEQELVGDGMVKINEEDSPLSDDAATPERPSACDEDANIVVLSPKYLEDENFGNTMQMATARGCHIVGIWPPGTVAQNLPKAFEDYGGATVIWDANRLRQVVSQPDAPPTWSLPNDQPRQERPLKRNKC